jgi:Tol biopolymer transport system component
LNGDALWAAPFDARNLSVTGPSFPVLQGFTVNPHFSTAQVAFSREGSIAYVPETGGHLENTLVKVDRAGHEQALTDIRRAYEDLALSPNGRFLALTVMGNPWSVWLYDLSRGTLGRLTFAGDNRDPIWTADSQRVIYASFRNGHFGLYWKPISGNESEEELITTASIPWPTSCSKDGKGCIYDLGIPEESAGVYLLPLFGERKPKAVVVEPFAGAGAISPDGKWAAYESRESGRTEIYVRPFPAGNRKWQVSTQGGTRPKWAASGRELFFREGEFRGQSRLVSVAVETEGEFRSSAPRILFPFHCEQAGHDYAVMPDGEHFLCIHESEAATRATQLNVVLNWNRELEKR